MTLTVTNLAEFRLRVAAGTSPYPACAKQVCADLGGPNPTTVPEAVAFLFVVAEETSEELVVEEINFALTEVFADVTSQSGENK